MQMVTLRSCLPVDTLKIVCNLSNDDKKQPKFPSVPAPSQSSTTTKQTRPWSAFKYPQDSGWHYHLRQYIWRTCEACQGSTGTVVKNISFEKREFPVCADWSQVHWLHCGSRMVCCWPYADKSHLRILMPHTHYWTATNPQIDKSSLKLHLLNLP